MSKLPFQELRSGETLRDFVDYCIKHPDDTFWKALRNWSEYDDILAVVRDKHGESAFDKHMDTFYFEGRRYDSK